MLSSDLDALAARFEGYARTGIELQPVACDAFAAVIAELAEEARRLEAQPVPPAARAVPAGDNVVALWDARRTLRHTLRSVGNPVDCGPDLPGGAA